MRAFVILLILGLPNLLMAQEIDSKNSYVEFEIGNMVFRSVDGKIGGMKGMVKFNENDLANSKFDVCIDPSTVDTENNDRDEHLKNPDFFDVSIYPTICFRSSSVKKEGSGYVTKGKLTLYDTTKDAIINFKKEGNKLVGTMEVNRFDYNLATKEYSTTAMVGEVAEVKIVCFLK